MNVPCDFVQFNYYGVNCLITSVICTKICQWHLTT